jgi:hypothetical protein
MSKWHFLTITLSLTYFFINDIIEFFAHYPLLITDYYLGELIYENNAD